MPTFQFEFEELPLVIHGDIEAAFINGQAEIRYSRDGSWETGDITVEGFGKRDPVTGKRDWPQVPARDWLAALIVERLNHQWEDRVQTAVNEQLEADRESAADDAADQRRHLREEDDR